MKSQTLYNQYVVIDTDGELLLSTATDMREFAESVHFAGMMPSSTKEAAIKAGFKLVKCDIVITNIKEII